MTSTIDPITPFVYNFLGNVNLFHGRIDEETPPFTMAPQESLSMCVRTCWRSSASPMAEANFRAIIKHINSAGPLVKIEALSEWGAPVQVELSQEKFRELQLAKEETVFIIPKELKVFQKKVV